jgi:serum/glucocorticoid-regulated kinase 2
MLAGIPPFYSEDVQEMYKKILYNEVKFPDFFSDNAKDLLSKLLEKNPSKRLGSEGAAPIKAHPFFSDVDWKKLERKLVEPPFKPEVVSLFIKKKKVKNKKN